MASKVLVIGEVRGAYEPTFKRLASLHAKQDFALAIIVGNLFSNDEDGEALSMLLDGKINVPISTYYTVGNEPFPQRVIDRLQKDEDVCENLHYIGKRSTTKTSDGIRIVALGGVLDENIIAGASTEDYLPFHTTTDARILKGANTTDILLTSTWPTNIGKGSNVPIPDSSDVPKYDHIAELCQVLKPRYHFTSSPSFFYEREPYFHAPIQDAPDSRPLTRFISLAATGNSLKHKAIYAFSLHKSVDLTAPLPSGTTPSPFDTSRNPRKRAALDSAPYSRFSNSQGGLDHKRFRGNRGPPQGPATCFFCLSNPDIGTHLIASIGEDAYLTVAKGPLVEASTNAQLGLDFPAHALIIPLAHESTLSMITDPEARTKSYTEMSRYKNALQAMVSLRSVDRLGGVTYEVSRTGIRHTHWQFVPMPVELIKKGVVEAAFKVEAENYQYPLFEVKDIGIGEGAGDFFRVWIWRPSSDEDERNEGHTTPLLLSLDSDMRFDLQFGRRVLAKLLGLENRIQWRDCEQSVEAETAEVDAFKNAFKEYDFTTT